jgi:POT family proton-dependent oligopeptide transporter
VPLALGWTLEGKLGPTLYDHFASKENFARQMLADKGLMPAAALGELKQGEAFSKLVELTHMDKWELTREIAQAHNIGVVWYIMATVGLVTALGIYLYGRWVAKLIAAK